MRTLTLVSFIVFFVFSCFVHAQNKRAVLQEGSISYTVTMAGDDEIAHIVNNSVMNLYFRNKQSRIDFSVMGGLANFQLIDNDKDDWMTVLMDIPSFYEKTAISLDADTRFFRYLNRTKPTNKSPSKGVQIEYYKSKRKRIASVSCYKALMILNSKEQLVLYLTDKIQPEVPTEFQKTFGDLKGFPMSAEMMVNGVLIKIEASHIKRQRIHIDAFEVPESYAYKSMEQFLDDLQGEIGSDIGAVGL